MQSTDDGVRTLIEAWKVMVGRLPGADIQQDGGVASMFGHVPLPFLNLSAQDRPAKDVDDLRGLLRVGQERAAACQHGSLLCVCEDWLPSGWEQVAAEAGLAPMLWMTGMEAGELLAPRRPAPDLELRRVSDDATARDAATINAHAYGMPPELFECICNMDLWHEDSFGYVGYADGRAVTTASTFPVDGTVYVALVATMPDSHGKGYADTVMRHAIAMGRQGMGLTRTTLHATDMGQPVYRAMGFVSGTRIAALGPAGH